VLIKSIKLQNYRNYSNLELSFHEKTNIFYGDNGQGKTNILEALYLAGTTKSHRRSKDRDLIQFGYEEGHIEMVVEKNHSQHIIDIHLKKNNSKGIAINKIPIRRAGELFGLVHFIFFSPEDLNLIKAGPSARRRFMDLELCQLDKIYLNNLHNYNKVVSQRNALLRESNKNGKLIETLDVWDMQLVKYGNEIIDSRRDFIDKINKIVDNIQGRLTGNREDLRIFYDKNIETNKFDFALKKNREKDIKMKATSVGPHRDDICFISNKIDLRHFGSQGQQRTAALALKLAELELVRETIRDAPVLLLDDVLSELDQHRQGYLLNSIRGIQTLITGTGLDELEKKNFSLDRVFYVEKGKVINQKEIIG